MAEIDRGALTPDPAASVQVLLVDPQYQRQGIGAALLAKIEERVRAEGRNGLRPGAGSWRFWSGVPDDLPGARAFFEKQGFVRNYEAVDLYGSLADYQPSADAKEQLARAGVESEVVTADRVGFVYDLLVREAPAWRRSYLMLVEAGDAGNVIYFSKGGEGVGCIQTYTPGSRFRGPNLVWEGKLGTDLGGFGAVLIAKAWRGRGLGAALCHVAAAHIRGKGATGCYIDWTNDTLTERLYSQVGTSVWARFGMYSRTFA
jgi:GNAT superfamily N-acetyltransferase